MDAKDIRKSIIERKKTIAVNFDPFAEVSPSYYQLHQVLDFITRWSC
jgi:hypothetical protein